MPRRASLPLLLLLLLLASLVPGASAAPLTRDAAPYAAPSPSVAGLVFALPPGGAIARESAEALAAEDAALRAQVARDPADRFALHRLGTVSFHRGLAPEATALWTAAARAEPNLPPAELMAATERVFALAARGDMDGARRALAEAEARFGTTAHFRLIRGEQAERAGNLDVAEAEYRAAQAAAPRLFVVELALGRVAEARDQHEAARRHYAAAAERGATRPEPWLALARHQFRQGALDEARASFTRAATAAPRIGPAEALMAQAAETIGDDIAARRWWRAALARGGDQAALRIALVNAQLRLGLFAEALEELAQLDETDSAPLAFTRGVIAESMGDDAEAERAYRRALARAPDSHVVQNNLAMTLVRQGRGAEEALRLAEAALRQVPSDATVLGTHACALALAGRTEQAHAALSQAVRASPRDAWVRFHLGLAEAGRGNAEAARLHLEGVLILQPAFPRRAEVAARLAALPR